MASQKIIGVDFTSAPSSHKPIVVARCQLTAARLVVHRIDPLFDFASFEALLQEEGPWVGGFDLPLGLPRELVTTLNWPCGWHELVGHIRDIGKIAFKDALNGVRESRPMGSRYIARRGDARAGASSPMKLVNPPVGLMFFEGAFRISRSGVCVLPCAPSADTRIALEAYPGFLARQITASSYKKDGVEGRSPARRDNRELLVGALLGASAMHPVLHGLLVEMGKPLRERCVDDGSGDTLDSVLCATQAAIAALAQQRGQANYGIPAAADPLEGWIATVPDS